MTSAAFLVHTIVSDGYTIKFEIWDTAGQERYKGILKQSIRKDFFLNLKKIANFFKNFFQKIGLGPMYYRGARSAIVVYDITNYVKATYNKLAIAESR